MADAHTQDIARTVFDKFVKTTGKTPHLIINNLHRSKMDPNREFTDATQGNLDATDAYNAYHDTIKNAKKTFQGIPGLLIDFHGQGHEKNSTEIGYLIKKANLNSGNFVGSELGIKSLVQRKNARIEDFVFGDESIGALFEAVGFHAVPSPRQNFPGTDLYYRGGYTVQTHGSNSGGVVDAIQLEFPGEIRIDGKKKLRDQFSVSLAKIIERFYKKNYKDFSYVEYIPGDTNLIFTVPHDGKETPDHLPTRQQGCQDSKGVCKFPGKKNCKKNKICTVATKGDANTQDIARTVFTEFKKITGKTPHLIINNVHRSKMDPNRVIEDAAQGHPGAIAAYNAYHGTIIKAKAALGNTPGLLIDFHGQAHKQNSTEIGYLIWKAQLNSQNFTGSELSIKSLVRRKNGKMEGKI